MPRPLEARVACVYVCEPFFWIAAIVLTQGFKDHARGVGTGQAVGV